MQLPNVEYMAKKNCKFYAPKFYFPFSCVKSFCIMTKRINVTYVSIRRDDILVI